MSTEDISPNALRIFHGVFLLSQISVIALIGLLISFAHNDLGGFDSLFSWHPFLGVLGLIVLQGESILIYRALRNVRKPVSKSVHGALHFAGFGCAFSAVVIIFKLHHGFSFPSSLHGILGLSSVTLFLAQYVIAFIIFFFPGCPGKIRATLLPVHVFGGVAIFILSCLTVLVKLGAMGSTKTKWLSFTIIEFALLVAILVTFSAFRRRPLPADA